MLNSGALSLTPSAGSSPFQGSNYGFCAGGSPTANADVVNRFSFTSDGNAGDWGDLAIGSNQGSGQSSTTHGYNSGGWLASGGSTAGSNIIQKFSFSTTNTSSDVADLAHSVYVVSGGQSSSDNGYACGGRTSTEHDYIQKFNFATEANATDIGNLIGIAQKTAGHSSSTHGWVSGGLGGGVYSDVIQKFSFSSDGDATDIANLTYKLLSTTLNGQTDFLYFRLDAKYNHILIDEFQDTSLLQYKILKPLIDEVFNGIGTSYKTFFYVGDIKQSIYRFRGGKSDLFDYLSSNYDNLKVENLTRNYRSSSNIVKFVNDVFMPLPNFDMVEQSWNKEGGLVEVIDVDEDFGKDKEFKDISNTINDLLEKGMSPNDIAILTYTNADVLNILEYLKQHLPSIEISTDMTSKLINVSNVKAIINYIKYLYFPIDKRDIYKENFNTLVGYELKKEMELHINIKTNNLRQIIYECAKYYDLFDDNVIKFLSNIDQYTDVVDFIYNIHNDESTIVNKHSLGITILTVFKSKGLEFDTVLLLDRIKSKNSDKSSLLFEYDKVNLKQTHYKIKYKEFFDNQYKDALEEEKRLQYLDELNILYVALTRAENNLFIFKKQKKKSSKSINAFDIIKHNNTSIGSLIIKPKEKIENNIIKIKEYKSLELGLQNKKKANDTNESNIYAQYFGIATHYCLEMMNKFDMNSLDKSILQTRARYSNYLNDVDFKKIFRICKNLIENMNFQSMIKGFDITKEQALNFNGEMKILDLLCMKKDEIIVFDYKTTISHNTEHNSQVSYYKKALSTIFPKAKVEGFLVYLQENSVDIINV